MIHFFPELYPDELLYSGIARYHIRVGNLDAKATLRDLYGKDTITAMIEMTSNLDILINNLPTPVYSVSELIRKNTMYLYFTAFVPEEKAERIYQLMQSDNGSRIYNEIGLNNKILKLNNFLRFCPECYKEDIDKYGETYWHRMHQVAGLDYCINHKCRLLDSGVSVRNKNRQEYINADLELKKYDIEQMEREQQCSLFFDTNDILEKSIILGKDVQYFMNNVVKHKELNYFREIYLDKLIKLGLANRKSIFQDIILLQFKLYWGEDFLNSINCNFDIKKASNWVTTITRKHRKGFHPIQHILVINFLGLDVKEVFDDKICVSKNTKIFNIKSNEEKLKYRVKWQNLINEFPDENKTNLRRRDMSTYTWLYRHDNEWLKKNSPTKKVGNRKEQLIDWSKRDEEILQEVKKVIKELEETLEKPKRITLTLIGKLINRETLIGRHLSKLPKTKEFIENNLECLEQFQVRRIKWAIIELDNTNKIYSKWDVMNKAGLRNILVYEKYMMKII